MRAKTLPPPECWPALMAAGATPAARGLIATLLYTGARLSQALRLRVGDVDLDGELVFLLAAEGREARDLHPALGRALRPLLGAAAGAPLFRSARGGALSERQARRGVRDAGAAAGCGASLSPDTLRAAFAAAVWRRTGDLELLQELLGHGDPFATRRYLRRNGLLALAAA